VIARIRGLIASGQEKSSNRPFEWKTESLALREAVVRGSQQRVGIRRDPRFLIVRGQESPGQEHCFARFRSARKDVKKPRAEIRLGDEQLVL
jgi:hypothetical protein